MTQLLKSCLLTAALLPLSQSALAQADEFTIKLGGRLHIEYTAADFDGTNIFNDDDTAVIDSIDETEIRRARIKASGNVNNETKYKLEFNHTSGGDIDIEDAYVQYTLPKIFDSNAKWKVKLGHFKTQNSLEEAASSNTNHIIERAAFTDAFSLNRRVGIELATTGDNYLFQVGAFTTNANSEGGVDEGRAYAARAVFNPIKNDTNVAHLGASWRYRNAGETEGLEDFRQRPFTHVTSERIIETEDFSESDHFYGFEAAFIHDKKLWVSGEYAALDANAGEGTDFNGDVFEDASFDGFSVEAGYLFGGEQGYKSGKLSRTKVDTPLGEGGWGAVSLVARYDTLDLSEGPGEFAGELDTFAVGANWWMTDYTRIAVSYFNVDADSGTRDSGQGIVTRLQLDF